MRALVLARSAAAVVVRGQDGLDALTQLVVRSWLDVDDTIERCRATTIVRVLLHPAPMVDVAEGLLDFASELDVNLAGLRKLRLVLGDVLRDSGSDVATWRRVTARFDDLFLALANRSIERVQDLGLHDPLTGLGNRRAAMLDLESALAQVKRHGRTVTVALVDLDGLKRINDEQGHAAGDAALVALADALRTCVRVDDGVHRMGGDEFLLVARDSSPSEMRRLVDRVAAVAPPFSAGSATAPDDAEDVTALLAVADARLYAAKRDHHGAAHPQGASSQWPLLPGAVATVLAEVVRRVAAVPLTGSRTMVWAALLLTAPAAFALAQHWLGRTDADRRRTAIDAAVVTIALLAALVLLAS